MHIPEQHRFGTLDAMRGVAALVVLLYHVCLLCPEVFAERRWFVSGYLAVDLFFLLSGFVIAFAYDRRLAANMRIRDFLVVRMIRLLPMLWVGVAIGGTILFVRHQSSPARVAAAALANAAIMPNLLTPSWGTFPTDMPEWSLFFEMTANLAFAVAFRWLRRLVLPALVVIAGGVLAVETVRAGNVEGASILGALPLRFARVGFSFFLGVLISRSMSRWQRWMPVLPGWAILVLMIVPFVGAPSPGWRPAYDLLFVALVSPAMVMSGAVAASGGVGRRAGIVLGEISYPLYVIHVPILEMLQFGHGRSGWGAGVWQAITILLLVPVSYVLGRSYDEPVRGWLSRRWRRRHGVSSATEV